MLHHRFRSAGHCCPF